jgi:hypothetical protein
MMKMGQHHLNLTLAVHICYVHRTRRHACQWDPSGGEGWSANPSILWLVPVTSACRPVCMLFVWRFRQ